MGGASTLGSDKILDALEVSSFLDHLQLGRSLHIAIDVIPRADETCYFASKLISFPFPCVLLAADKVV